MGVSSTLTRWLTDYGRPDSVGSRLRARRVEHLLSLIRVTHQEHGHVRLVDIGGTSQYWEIVPRDFLRCHRVHITLTNIERDPGWHAEPGFSFAVADGCELSGFGDREFHIAHSNSVIEHVGEWECMRAFASEVRRVAPRHFVQTPNFWFPIEPHSMTPLFHWLPEPTRLRLVRSYSLGHWRRASSPDEAVEVVRSARLLNRAMMVALFPDSTILTERALGLPKSLIAVKI